MRDGAAPFSGKGPAAAGDGAGKRGPTEPEKPSDRFSALHMGQDQPPVLPTADFSFDLPEELIAQDPLPDRSASRLLCLDRETGAVSHHIFREIGSFLRPGDCLVLNDTKVIPARLLGKKPDTGAAVELLLLERKGDDLWEALARPGRKLRPGAKAVFGDGRLLATIEGETPDGNRLVRFSYQGVWEEVLDSLGEMPLPPYITHKLRDRDRYQTVYAKYDGSAAAPTAGLHFTGELLEELQAQGVVLAYVTLHVGLGTFRPVREENALEHQMHSEHYRVSAQAARQINQARSQGGRIICVGTTSARTLESAADGQGRLSPCQGDTALFIYPGYRFRIVDGLVTNFHLPESTLMMLVCAFAGREHVMAAYQEAIRERYRFYSFGDAMLIL